MAAGLPVIATRSGGPQEIIEHQSNGWLVDTGDPKIIADVLEKLSTDHELSDRLGLAGREHAIDTFDIQSMVAAYDGLYKEYTQN